MRFSVSKETQENYDAYLAAYVSAVNDSMRFLIDATKATGSAYQADSPGHLAALLLVRHVIESIDGVQVLVAQGSVHPCETLLRSALEAFLGVNYILSGDNDRRGLAFLTADHRKQLKHLRQCDPDDEIGKEVRKHNTPNQIAALIGDHPIIPLRTKIAALQADLNDLPLKPINDEFDRMRASAKAAKPSLPCPTCGHSEPPPLNQQPFPANCQTGFPSGASRLHLTDTGNQPILRMSHRNAMKHPENRERSL